ncbi:hypothetical protein G7Y31_03640 [Corynebacterium lizhenjunii]|uniref:SAF domain-containing protein n=1 Tax=Corynebacterium lizhenjunii TaxID=2709394 RepID=A0A7T0PB54_9CORY|nr:SAF domain-containing protein [Corynebacterium lizhenjunii]QPK79801.1 hypothetical protein G7Y31_03640 [Corynebacterium lizhenjunii]
MSFLRSPELALAHWRAQLSSPGRARSMLVRRAIATVLFTAALLVLAFSVRQSPQAYVFAAPVTPGEELGDSQVELRRIPRAALPKDYFGPGSSPVGSVVVAGASPGEIITPARVLGTQYTTQLVRRDIGETTGTVVNLVPVALADPDMASLLHHGDTVSVLSAGDKGVIATGGRVVSAGITSPGTILLAFGEAAAQEVAAAGLTMPLTVVITGPRASGSLQ